VASAGCEGCGHRGLCGLRPLCGVICVGCGLCGVAGVWCGLCGLWPVCGVACVGCGQCGVLTVEEKTGERWGNGCPFLLYLTYNVDLRKDLFCFI
jgi:hypothetical protein